MASFIGELKRRNVFRVAVSYAIVAWLLIQIAATVLPTFDAPRWVLQTLTFIVILGFPAAVVLAWAYEVTAEGVKLTSAAGQELGAAGNRRWNGVVIGLLLLAVAFLAIDNYLLPDRVPGEETRRAAAATSPAPSGTPAVSPASGALEPLPNSVAVLPFVNLSPDPNNAYFAAGIHETVLHELVKVRDLNVIARTAVLRYADGSTPLEQIARELRVETIMEGSVQYADDRVRITAQLIDPVTGSHLWSENYDRDFADLFAIQSDIATRIATTLEAQLLASERASIAKPLTSSPEAQALFLKALTTVGDLGPGTPRELSAQFQALLDEAIALDPNFARAYALKAVDYASYPVRPRLVAEANSLADWEARVRENAGRALELDPTLGVAHAALGRLHETYMREAEARSAYERAFELSPNDRDVLIDYSNFATNTGRREQAIELAERAVELDPIFGSVVLWLAYARFGELAKAAALTPTLQRNLGPTWGLRGALAEIGLGRDAEALATLRAANRADIPRVPQAIAQHAYAFGRLGREAEARELVNELESIADQYLISPESWVLASLALGDREGALEALEAAAADRTPNNDSWNMPAWGLEANVFRDPILDEPEFAAIRRELAFTPASGD